MPYRIMLYKNLNKEYKDDDDYDCSMPPIDDEDDNEDYEKYDNAIMARNMTMWDDYRNENQI